MVGVTTRAGAVPISRDTFVEVMKKETWKIKHGNRTCTYLAFRPMHGSNIEQFWLTSAAVLPVKMLFHSMGASQKGVQERISFLYP